MIAKISITIDEGVLDELRRRAVAENRTLSNIVDTAVRDFLLHRQTQTKRKRFKSSDLMKRVAGLK